MITATGIELRAGPRLLLDNASFRIAEGDRIGLVGRTGAGTGPGPCGADSELAVDVSSDPAVSLVEASVAPAGCGSSASGIATSPREVRHDAHWHISASPRINALCASPRR